MSPLYVLLLGQRDSGYLAVPTEGAGSGDSTGHTTDAPNEERGCGQTTESGCTRTSA